MTCKALMARADDPGKFRSARTQSKWCHSKADANGPAQLPECIGCDHKVTFGNFQPFLKNWSRYATIPWLTFECQKCTFETGEHPRVTFLPDEAWATSMISNQTASKKRTADEALEEVEIVGVRTLEERNAEGFKNAIDLDAPSFKIRIPKNVMERHKQTKKENPQNLLLERGSTSGTSNSDTALGDSFSTHGQSNA